MPCNKASHQDEKAERSNEEQSQVIESPVVTGESPRSNKELEQPKINKYRTLFKKERFGSSGVFL